VRYSTEFMTEKYKVLPENIRDIARSPEVVKMVSAICKKNSLHKDIEEILFDELTYVIFGVEKATNFKRNIKEKLNLPDEKINAIERDVNEIFFLPVLDVLLFECWLDDKRILTMTI
jgi:hypothetical protein